jgi:pseudouridine synthase
VLIARAGLASRREAERLIAAGEVVVNGRVVTEAGTLADPERDSIKVAGRKLPHKRRFEYYLFHKPVGCVSTMKDPEGRFSVGDVAGGLRTRVFPVGRLDFHSSGLLLLTNDGPLAQRLTHPRHDISKTYVAKLSRRPAEALLGRLRRGVELEEGTTRPARVRLTRKVGDKAWIEISIAEGRNQQIRRMFEALGVRVEKLRRTQLGPLKLGRMAAGTLRRLDPDELAALRSAVGL